MIDEKCLGPDIDRLKISPAAVICGASYLTGRHTSVGPGAVVRGSRVHNGSVLGGATLIDSIFIADGDPRTHKCDSAGRTIVGGTDRPSIASGVRIAGSTLINTSVAAGATVSDTWARDSHLGPRCAVSDAKIDLVNTGPDVTVAGPTEVSEAYLGAHAVIDRRGYFEGIFSNAFRKVRFNESTGDLEVTGVVALPHVSVYGVNTICSTNSGKLLAQPGGVLKDLGPHVGLWHDELLSHEQVELGPCCWVAPWTKVIGQSPQPHATDDELVNDEMMTYVMPFAVAGFGGELTRGLVMPGELSNGIGPKQRRGAWTFTYAPGAVIAMVRRLRDALPQDRRDAADTIVTEAIRVAVEMTRALAARRGVDLNAPADEQRPGWPRWLSETYRLLRAHLESQLWTFRDGEPAEWRRENGRWTHPRIGAILEIAPDAMDAQVGEEEILAVNDPIAPARVAVPTGSVEGTAGPARIDKSAVVADDAFIGPGCRIDRGAVIGPKARLWKAVVSGGQVSSGAVVDRSVLTDARIGDGTIVRSSRVSNSTIGERSTVESADVVDSRLAEAATISPFGRVEDVEAGFGTILGGAVRKTKIETFLMSMHLAGECSHLSTVPTPVDMDGRIVQVPAIPMIGAGAIIRGTDSSPVEMECCFIGSNAVIERGAYLGFGCFVLGEIGPDEGLAPFTVSTGGGAHRHQIGGVLGSLAGTIITHFVNWTFQATGPQLAPAVAEMVRQSIARGLSAVKWEFARREGKNQPGGERFECFRSLKDYSREQLASGEKIYHRALESGAWEMIFRDGRLCFSSAGGAWQERSGSAFWKKS